MAPYLKDWSWTIYVEIELVFVPIILRRLRTKRMYCGEKVPWR